MPKPIAYYLSDQEDAETIAEISSIYGDRLEKLSVEERSDFLRRTAMLLDQGRLENHTVTAPEELLSIRHALSNDTLLALIIATAQQLREDLRQAK